MVSRIALITVGAGFAVAIGIGLAVLYSGQTLPLTGNQGAESASVVDQERNAQLNRILQSCTDDISVEDGTNWCDQQLSVSRINEICTIENPEYDICKPESLRKIQTYRDIRSIMLN